MNEAEKLKKRISHIFLKKGGEGLYTKLFENFSFYEKELFLNDISLKEGELPVILGFEIPAEWLLLTTERIIWRRKAKIEEVQNSEIKEGNVDFDKMLLERKIGFYKIDELVITKTNNQKIIIYPEIGSPLVGIWNVLIHLGWRTWKQSNDEISKK